ncbi:ABC transporter permease [Pseudoflavonifractor intestinihominis]|uniref:ABC transporter permease n=1 Tax=Pseudoflavonifractor intestinihominis TaxID=3133171 RepID=A0ABV1E9B5_9FIRM|nr:ABC transporter permease [uncultured Pseudoflavonifractor sp.]
MADIIQVIFNTDFFFTTIRVMTPVLYAAMACMVFYKGGVDAIGTEGIMLLCSLAGVLGGYFTGSAFLGVVIAFAAGAFFACLYTFVVLRLGSEAILAGIALNTLASGLTIFVLYYVTGEKGSTQSLNSPVCPSIDIPILKDIPILGDILSGHNILTYVAVLLVIVLFFLIYKTPTGLRIRTVGENPQAARSVGIHVRKYRYLTSIIAGGLAGMGGAFMSMAYVSNFSREMIAGRGYIGMAAEGMGRGTPLGVLLSSIIFGAADSLATRLQMLNVPARLVQALPYAITIIAIAIYSYIRTQRKAKNSSGAGAAAEAAGKKGT